MPCSGKLGVPRHPLTFSHWPGRTQLFRARCYQESLPAELEAERGYLEYDRGKICIPYSFGGGGPC